MRTFDNVADASTLVHDTFRQSAQSRYNLGPAEAFDELVRRHPERLQVTRSGLGLPGLTLLASNVALASASTA